MPGAVAGKGDDTGYSFTIVSEPDQVLAYYQKELAKRGWFMLASGENDQGNLLAIFQKGDSTMSIATLKLTEEEGLLYIMLVQS